METHYNTIIVGGGIVGASVAYHLTQVGVDTLLIDRRDVGRATNVGAGILAPEMNTRDPESWFNFAVEAVAYYPKLVAQLDAQEAGDTGYARCGMLLVAATEDEVEPFEHAKEQILSRQARRGTPSVDDLHLVSAGEAKELFPALTDVHSALYYHNAARVDGRLMAQAMHSAANRQGLTTLEAGVERLLMSDGQVTGVVVDGEAISAGHVVIAGGAWSPAFGAQLGVHIPVEPQRGQIIHLTMPVKETWSDTAEWPIVSAFHGHYIVCWAGGRVVVGATREPDTGFAPQTTVTGIQEVLDEAMRVAPGLASAQLHEIRVGLRPYCVDGLPVLCRVPNHANVIMATGNGPTGLQLGPLCGKVAAELVMGNDVGVDIAAFDITRFGKGH
ncbi:MAG: FAD-dependent oxidoreductase [Chloroflexota bacterium]